MFVCLCVCVCRCTTCTCTPADYNNKVFLSIFHLLHSSSSFFFSLLFYSKCYFFRFSLRLANISLSLSDRITNDVSSIGNEPVHFFNQTFVFSQEIFVLQI